MRTFTPDELKEIIEKHLLWLKTRWGSEPQGERADLTDADLTRAYLTGADLTDAYLTGANLTGAYLTGAYLTGANLTGAYLTGANLTRANLRGAYLTRADLRGADLTDANLTRANLTDANLTRAYLTGADLRGADLTRADLRGANLTDANLTRETKFPDFQICPEKGSFIAWKKVRGAILELQIPASAKRTSSLVGRKCRASKAKVLKAHGCIEGETQFQSNHDSNFIWTVGEMHEVADFNGDIRIECAPGLHFFITRKEAENY